MEFLTKYGEDAEKVIQKVSCPVLLIHGENDYITKADRGKKITDLIGTNAQHKIIPGDDHLCSETIGKGLADEIFDWIANDVAEQCRQGANIRYVAIDSIKSIKGPKEQNLKDSEDHIMGDLASYLPKAFKLIVEPIRRHKILTILIQQVNEEMDQIKKKFDPYKIPNGKALHHFADYYCLFEISSRFFFGLVSLIFYKIYCTSILKIKKIQSEYTFIF